MYNRNKEQKLIGVFSERVPAPTRIFMSKMTSSESLSGLLLYPFLGRDLRKSQYGLHRTKFRIMR